MPLSVNPFGEQEQVQATSASMNAWQELLGQIDLNNNGLRFEPDAPDDLGVPDVPDAPDDAPETIQSGDMLSVVNAGYGSRLRRGETVTAGSAPTGCGNSYCTECVSVQVYTLRLSDACEPIMWRVQRLNASPMDLRHIEPTAFGQMVRCRLQVHGGRHRHNGHCVSPVRTCTSVLGVATPELEEAARLIWADEIEARELEIECARQRMLSMRIGQRYFVDNGRSSYYGMIATIVQLLPSGTNIIADVHYSDGECAARRISIPVVHLGHPFIDMMMGVRVPDFLRFQETRYSGRVTVSDRDPGPLDGDQAHECDARCFDLGCQAPLPTRSDDYYNDDDDDDDDRDSSEMAGDVPIHSYSYRPNPIFCGKGPVYLGTELELSTGHGATGERSQNAAAKLLTTSDVGHLVYLKSDGSISGYGFEAVFHPMSYDFLIENWPVDLLRSMRSVGADPHNSCGMHVHVSRSGFSDAPHAFKWIKFMYRNKYEIGRMARRNPSAWGSFDRPEERAAAKWHAKGGYGAQNRYTAINCIPRDTYEVRIFASTLNRTRFLGSLGLVDASVEYTRQLSTSDILGKGGWGFGPFREYANSFDKYAPLRSEMDRILG